LGKHETNKETNEGKIGYLEERGKEKRERGRVGVRRKGGEPARDALARRPVSPPNQKVVIF